MRSRTSNDRSKLKRMVEILNPNSILSFILAGSHALVGYLRGFNACLMFNCIVCRFASVFYLISYCWIDRKNNIISFGDTIMILNHLM